MPWFSIPAPTCICGFTQYTYCQRSGRGLQHGVSLDRRIPKTCECVCLLFLVRKRCMKCFACIGGDIYFVRRLICVVCCVLLVFWSFDVLYVFGHLIIANRCILLLTPSTSCNSFWASLVSQWWRRLHRSAQIGGRCSVVLRARFIELRLCGGVKSKNHWIASMWWLKTYKFVLCSRNATLFVCLFVMRDIELRFSLCVP